MYYDIIVFAARCVCIARTMLLQDVCPSVRLSVCPCVTRRYSDETAKRIVKLVKRIVNVNVS